MNPMTLRIAWRNLWRHPQRTALMIAIVAFGSCVILVMWGLTDGFFSSMTHVQASENLGDFQLRAASYADDPIPTNGLTPDQVAAALEAVRGLWIQSLAPRLETFGMLRSAYGTDGVVIRGVDPVKEQTVTTLHENVTAGGYLAETAEIVISAKMAESLDVRLGERVVLLAQGDAGTVSQAFTAVGFFSSTLGMLEQAVLIPLEDARTLTGWHGATAIAVNLPQGASVQRAIARVEARLPEGIVAADYYDLNPLARALVAGGVIKMIPFVVLISLLAGFGVANTTFYSVLERTREFGVMTAVGMSRRQLARVVLSESVFVAAIGFAVGGGIGYGALLYLSRVGVDFGRMMGEMGTEFGIPTILYASTSGYYWIAAFSVVVFTALVAAWYPARRASRLEPVTAIREG